MRHLASMNLRAILVEEANPFILLSVMVQYSPTITLLNALWTQSKLPVNLAVESKTDISPSWLGPCHNHRFNTLGAETKWQPFLNDIFKCIFLNWNFDWNLFPRVQLTKFEFRHWFRWWLGAGQASSHYLNQWWLVYRRIYSSLGLNELSNFIFIWKDYVPCPCVQIFVPTSTGFLAFLSDSVHSADTAEYWWHHPRKYQGLGQSSSRIHSSDLQQYMAGYFADLSPFSLIPKRFMIFFGHANQYRTKASMFQISWFHKKKTY